MVEDAIEYFKEQGYINDLNYIERFVNEYIALKNLSIKELKYKLIGKGVSKDDLEKYFSENYEKLAEYEYQSAKNILSKKIKKDDEENIRNYLYKKGYMSDSINRAFEE